MKDQLDGNKTYKLNLNGESNNIGSSFFIFAKKAFAYMKGGDLYV